MKKVGLLVLVIFGFIGTIESLSSSLSTKEQDIDKQDANGETQLHRAVRNRDIETASILINKGANLNIENSHKDTPLRMAVTDNKIEMVKLLIDAKADVNKNEYGNTPLHASISEVNVYQSNIETTKLLIAAKADVNIQDPNKNTPLHSAVSRKDPNLVKLLVAAKADVNLQNKYGENPLLHCLRNSRCLFKFSDDDFAVVEIIKLLINAKSNVNLQVVNTSKYELGATALHFAVNVNNTEAVKLLLDAGADKNIKDYYGKTALHYARTQEMKDLLIGKS